MGEGRRRARQMGPGGRDQAEITGALPDLRASRLLHGVDQRHEPALVPASWPAKCRSRRLKLSSHRRRILLERRQPGIRRVVPASLPQRKCGRCDLLHRGPFRFVVLLRNDQRTAPDDVGPPARPRDRLRSDRNWRGGCLDRIGLPHSGLRNRAQQPHNVSIGAAARKKVQAVPYSCQRRRRSTARRVIPDQTPSSAMHPAVPDSHIALCESCIRHIRAFALRPAGA